MATYEITGPDGNKYQVVGPEGASQDDVIKYVQTQMQGGQSVRKTSPEYPNLAGQEIDVSGGTQARAAAGGIPGLSAFVSPTPESQRFEQAFPKNAAADKVIAGGLATAPLFAATPELLPSMVMGGAISGVDAAAHGKDPGEIALSTGLGMAGSTLGRGTGAGTGNMITPHPSTPEYQALVHTLQAEVPGVRLSAGQATGSQALRFKEAERGRAIDYNPDEPLQRDVTQELMRRVGHQPTLATQPEMDAALQNISDTFNRVYSRNNLAVDPQLGNDIHRILRDYRQTHAGPEPPIFQGIADNIAAMRQWHVNAAQNRAPMLGPAPLPTVPGDNYGQTRSTLAAMERRTGANAADADNAHTAGEIREALDEAFERSISRNPTYPNALEDLGALRQARAQYRNFLPLQKAAAGNSTAANQGYITPGALQTAVKGTEGTRAYATGRGPLSELSNAYAGVDRGLPFSGTSEYLKNQTAERALPLTLGGYGMGELYAKNDEDKAGTLDPLIGGLGGYALNRGLGAAQAHWLLNPGMQAYLRNQIMTPWMRSILRALGAGAGTSATPQIEPSAKHVVDTLTGNKNAPQQ